MKEFILNERKYVEDCLTTGKINKKPRDTLTLMAQYYYQVNMIRKKGIAELLIDFMDKNYPLYQQNKNSWNETCEKIANKTGGVPLLELDGVWITKPELEAIMGINNRILERLAFTMLCIAKLNNARKPVNNNWVNNDLKTICKAARVTGTKANKELLMFELIKKGLIEIPKRSEKINFRVLFLNDNGEKELFISDFRELGYEYQFYRGEPLTRCKGCGILRRRGDSNFCKNCESAKQTKTRTVICVDCGEAFQVDVRVVNKCRCDNCQKIKLRSDAKKRKQREREKRNMSRSVIPYLFSNFEKN